MGTLRLVLVAALAAVGCAGPTTQLVVVVDSDLRAGDEIARVEIAVLDASGATGDRRVVDLATTALPFSFGALPRDGSPLRLEARALAPDGSVVVSRRAIAPFTTGETRRIVVRLDRACASVACAEETTCVAGACADPALVPEPIAPGRELELDGGVRDEPDAARCAPGACDPAVQVEVGEGFACTILASGRVACWGARNESGQLGNGTRDPSPGAATIVDGVIAPVALGVGDAFACAQGESGAWCWGDGASGQLASGSAGSSDVALPLGALGAPRFVYVGGRSACAAVDTGVACWGEALAGTSGAYAESCDGHACARSPVDEPALAAAAEVAASGHTCARVELQLLCAGANDAGQLGDGTRDARDALAPVDAGVVWGFAASARSTCAIVGAEEGTSVRCWGEGALGQLGAAAPDLCGDAACALRPIDAALAGGGTVIELAAVEHTFCARMGDGRVLCWGADADGALGDGPGAPERCGEVPCTRTPDAIAGIADAIDLDGAAGTFCVVRRGGTVACWGRGHGDAPVPAPEAMR